LLKDAKPLKNRARVHLHAFSSETIAEVALYDQPELKPGGTAFAQLRTADPLLLLPGDRAILRQFSPVITIGGAIVLDSFPLDPQKKDPQKKDPQKKDRQKKRKEDRLAFLKIVAEGTREQTLLARISRRQQEGLTLAAAVRETGLQATVLQPMVSSLAQQKKVAQAGDCFVAADVFSRSRERAIAFLDTFHKANPLVAGLGKEELREKLGLPAPVLEGVLADLGHEKKIEITGEQVRLAGRGVELKDEEAKAKEQIEKAFADAGLKVPLMKEVLASLPVDKARAQKLVTLLLRDRVLIKLADELVFHRSALEQLRRLMVEQKAKSPKIDVGQFKDLIGVTRKYAIPLLEYLDQQRVTRRVGDERIIL
jgi:selenocysteine-specific elongation factor